MTQTTIPTSSALTPMVYGSVVARFVAMVLDGILITLAFLLLLIPFWILVALGLIVLGPFIAWLGVVAVPTGGLLYLALWWLYFAGFESSARGATLGKRIMGLRVVGYDGGRIYFPQATLRFFGKFISAFPMLLGFIMAIFTPRRQALHDILAGTLVISV